MTRVVEPSALTYSPVSVLTLIFVPSTMNWGTITVSPVSVFAGLNDPVAVALFRLGSVSVTVSTTLGGSCTPSGRSW